MILFKIKRWLGLYKKNSSVWINVIQTDGVEYSCEVNVYEVEKEIERIKPFIKSIKICG